MHSGLNSFVIRYNVTRWDSVNKIVLVSWVRKVIFSCCLTYAKPYTWFLSLIHSNLYYMNAIIWHYVLEEKWFITESSDFSRSIIWNWKLIECRSLIIKLERYVKCLIFIPLCYLFLHFLNITVNVFPIILLLFHIFPIHFTDCHLMTHRLLHHQLMLFVPDGWNYCAVVQSYSWLTLERYWVQLTDFSSQKKFLFFHETVWVGIDRFLGSSFDAIWIGLPLFLKILSFGLLIFLLIY